jgi:hypothetical protein
MGENQHEYLELGNEYNDTGHWELSMEVTIISANP